jgi:putative transposase
MRQEYVGSEVLETFDRLIEQPSKAFKCRSFSVPVEEHSSGDDNDGSFLRHNLFFDCSRDFDKLRKFVDKLRQQDLLRIDLMLEKHNYHRKDHVNALVKPYKQLLLKTSPRIRRSLQQNAVLQKSLQHNPCLKKKIKKLNRMRAIVEAKRQQPNKTYTVLSRTLNTSTAQIHRDLKAIVESNGNCLSELDQQIERHTRDLFDLDRFLKSITNNVEILQMSSRWKYGNFKFNHPNCTTISFSSFYQALKHKGFRYKSIRYERQVKRDLSRRHRNLFLTFICHLVLEVDKSELVFLDESAINPNNFRKHCWFKKGTPNTITTRMKYEKISMLGAVTARDLVSLQFVHSNVNREVFFNFVRTTLEFVRRRQKKNKTIVLMLDNCPIHRSSMLTNFCARKGVMLVYGLPQKCQFNLIEYFWEYMKRDLRTMTSYERFCY